MSLFLSPRKTLIHFYSSQNQCFELSIPDGDDAHLLFMPLNSQIPTHVEDWYVAQMAEIGRHDSDQFLKDLDTKNQPPALAINAKETKKRSFVHLYLELIRGNNRPEHMKLQYFELSKFENLAEKIVPFNKWDTSLGQYQICFDVKGRFNVKILFDSIIVSEYMEKLRKRHVIKKEHLTPLERTFDEGIALMHSVKDEMHFMTKREARMKQTTDAINSRLRYFSYLSIIILASVTYVQITYLKSYFRKKKIL